jgi:hypothetical protein
MDPQDGARMVWNGDQCDIHRLSELMLTRHTKLYKIAYFELEAGEESEPVGYLADNQSGPKRVSDYFLENFLCCKYPESPQEVTAKIHSATMAYINEKVVDPEHRALYSVALVSELSSSEPTFTPQSFAHKHMVGRDRDDYELFLMERESISADSTFPKDVTLITNRLKMTSLDFEGGINVVGSPEAFHEFVETQVLDGGRLELKVVDRLKTVKT